MMRPGQAVTTTFFLGAGLGTVAYGTMVVVDRWTGTLRAGSTPTTIALYLTAFLSYGAVIWANEQQRLSLRWLWAFPILFRLLLLATEPTLSDDVYRYLWDGHVLSNGINPYSYAVSAVELDRLGVPIRALVNNPDLSTPYLPTTQALFAGLAFGLPSNPLTMQAVMSLFDVAAAAVLWRLLPLGGLPARRAMLYLWNPLVIVEAAHGAHFDSLMTLLSSLAVWTAFDPAWNPASGAPAKQPGRPSWRRFVSPVALALAVLTRPVPLLFVPVLWWRWGWPQRGAAATVMAAALLPFGFGPSGWGLTDAAGGTGVFGSSRVYGAEFRFNAVVATWIEEWIAGSTGSTGSTTVVIGSLMALLVGTVWLRARTVAVSSCADVRSHLRLLAIPVLGYVLLTPVLHPWYLTIVVAFSLALTPAPAESARRWWLLVPWWYLCASVVFSYLTYLDADSFGELTWVRRLEWYPTLAGCALLAVAVWYGWLTGRPRLDVGAQRVPDTGSDGRTPCC
ncbi:MAG: hypothetical protein ACR2QK_20975 [Acidimicrobiales bacterium]